MVFGVEVKGLGYAWAAHHDERYDIYLTIISQVPSMK